MGEIYDQIMGSSYWKYRASVEKSPGFYFSPSFLSILNMHAAFPRAYYCVFNSSDMDLRHLGRRRGMDS